MNSAQLLGYPLLPIAALELFLGLLLLKQNPRNSPVNKATAACAFAAALWSLSAAVMYLRVSAGMDYLLFARMSWVGWFTVPTAIQTVLFLGDERSARARLVGWVWYPFWTVVLGLCLFTDLVVTDGFVPLPFRNSPGPLEMPLRLIGGLSVLWLVIEIVRLKRTVTGSRRATLGWYLYGTIIFGTGGAVIGGFLQLFTGTGLEPTLSAYFSFPWVLMIFYAITRYRLFDIRIVLSRVAGILLLSLLVSAFQAGSFQAIGSAAAVPFMFISIPLLGLLFFGTPVSRTVQRAVDDLILRDRYRYQNLLQESAHAMTSILNRDELLRYIVEQVRTAVKAAQVSLYLKGADSGYSLVDCGKDGDGAADCPLPRLVAEHLARGSGSLLREETEADPEGPDAGLPKAMLVMGAELVLPLASKGKLHGALSLGERRNGEPYLQEDIEVLQMVASHIAAAIENVRLFEEAVAARASLKEREGIFTTISDTSTAAILFHRMDGILFANKISMRMTGYTLAELMAMKVWQLVHPDYRDAIRDRGMARMRGEPVAPEYLELKYLRKDGEERWGYATSAVIVYEGRSTLLTMVVDITDLKQAEEEKAKHVAEKENILKDLHDGIGGLTTNINLLAEIARTSGDPEAVRRSLATIAELSRESLSEIRGFIQTLDARELTWHTLAAELRHLGSTIIEPHGIRLTVNVAGEERGGGPGSMAAMNLFRIYKEALSNIVKHARASTVEVAFTLTGEGLHLSISDDGVGMEGAGIPGRGLLNMRSRAAGLGGRLTFRHDEGTTVLLEIPLAH